MNTSPLRSVQFQRSDKLVTKFPGDKSHKSSYWFLRKTLKMEILRVLVFVKQNKFAKFVKISTRENIYI